MVKSAAQRQRERRERLKQHPHDFERYKKRDRERKKKAKDAMTPGERKAHRRVVKLAVRRCRENRHQHQNTDGRNESVSEAYATPASLGKAKRKAINALPKSPRKRAAVVRKLASCVLGTHVVPSPRDAPIQDHGNGISSDVKQAIRGFYENDSISRVMPGKADSISIKDDSGQKRQIQKRHLQMTLRETYQSFKGDNPSCKIGKSKFISLRPKWVLLSSQMPHNVCGCIYHSNIILLLESLHRLIPNIPLYSRDSFQTMCVCSVHSEDCMSGNCSVCSNGKAFDINITNKITIDKTTRLHWYQWTQDTDVGTCISKKETRGTVDMALDVLRNQLRRFLWHSFIKTKQAAAYESAKSVAQEPSSDTCLLQMDFAENFSCCYQDEIQSAHWQQRQVTLYTVMVYHRDKKLCYVIASDSRDHDKSTVAAFTCKMFEVIRRELPTATAVNIWTDGPSSQFKNKYIFALTTVLQKVCNLEITWNFFATSHGKGPNDALGGNVKRMVFRKVMTREAVVASAQDFADACGSANIMVMVMNGGEIARRCSDLGLASLWEGLKGVQGTLSTHYVKPHGDSTLITKFYATAGEEKMRSIVYKTITTEPTPIQTHACQPRTADSTKAQVKGTHEKTTAQKSRAADNNYPCARCQWAYGDINDPKLHDDWVPCQTCKQWFHLTCAEEDGIIDDDDLFFCYSCLQ